MVHRSFSGAIHGKIKPSSVFCSEKQQRNPAIFLNSIAV